MVSSFQKKRHFIFTELKLTVLLILINFFNNGVFAFFISFINFVILLSLANKNSHFLTRLSNDCQIGCPALISGPPQYNKGLFFKWQVSTVELYSSCSYRFSGSSSAISSLQNVLNVLQSFLSTKPMQPHPQGLSVDVPFPRDHFVLLTSVSKLSQKYSKFG